MDQLRFSMVGLSRWESVFVQTTVDLASGLDISSWRFVDDPKRADVLLVDGDRRSPVSVENGDDSQRPIVVSFTADPEATPPAAARGLTRPVGYIDLISVLKDIEQELHEAASRKPARPKVVSMRVAPKLKAVPKPKAVPTPKPKAAPAAKRRAPSADALRASTATADETLLEKARPARRFVEDTRLLGLLKTILRHGSSAAVRRPKFPTFLVIPDNNVFVSFGDPTSIPRMFRDSAATFSVSELAAEVEAKALASDRCRPLGQLLYCAALFGSEGRLVLNSKLDDRLCLVGFPDFDVVPHLQEHREIAKYMMARSTHLADIASSTGVSISVVIDFCNACEAVGLLRRISTNDGEYAHDVDERGVLQLFGHVQDLFKET